METLEIRVDVRERVGGVPEILARMPGVTLRWETLRSADYAVQETIGIERKSGPDLARSIVDGRIFRQAGRMGRAYERPFFLLEGMAPGMAVAGVQSPQIRGALVSVAAVFGIPVLYSADTAESAEIIVRAAGQSARIGSDAYRRPGYRPKGWRKRALFILQGLPGIGPKRAAELLDSFGDVRGVIQAEKDRLMEVSGIGERGAERILQAVAK